MTRRNRNTHARLAAWLLGAVLATAPTLALAHGPEAKAVKARLAPLLAQLEATFMSSRRTGTPRMNPFAEGERKEDGREAVFYSHGCR